MKKLTSLLILVLFFQLQPIKASAACEAEYRALLNARLKGVSETVPNQNYQRCLASRQTSTNSNTSQESEEARLEKAISEAFSRGDVSAASSLIQQLRSYNAAKANSYQSQLQSSAKTGCNYNGKFYADCQDAWRQYQIDLDNYNKQLEAAKRGSSTQRWQCAGQVFNTKAEADAYCDELNRSSASQSTNSNSSGSSISGGQTTSCPEDGSGSPDSPILHLVKDKDGKVNLKIFADKTTGAKKSSEFVVDIRKIAKTDKEVAIKANQNLVTDQTFEKSVVYMKSILTPDKDHLIPLEGNIQGNIANRNRCGQVFAYIFSTGIDVYDEAARKWSESVSETGPTRYQIYQYGICNKSSKPFEDYTVSVDYDEKGPIYKIKFGSVPPIGTTLSVSVGSDNNGIRTYSTLLLTHGDPKNQDLRIPQDSQYKSFSILTYVQDPCVNSYNVQSGTFKVLTSITGVSALLTTEEIKKVCESNKGEARASILNFETLLQSYQSSVSQYSFYSKYVTWLTQIKTENSLEYLDIQGDCPNKLSIDKFNNSIKKVNESIKQDTKVEIEKIKAEEVQAAANAKAEAEAKAKAKAEAEAAAELKAKQEAEAKAKKSITCVKGKSSLTVIGKMPLCPKGYKKN